MRVSMLRKWSWVLDNTYRENPLESCWHSPTPLVISLVVGVGDSGDNDASDGPAHLQRCSTCGSQCQWDDLTGIGGAVCDEEAPWDTFECLSDDEDFKRVGLSVVSNVLPR